jgi:hypothetical protein
MSLLPNRDRGLAAKRLYDQKHVVGDRVACRALMDGWEHDHSEMLTAFGQQGFIDALRDVALQPRRKHPVQAWRGVNGFGNIVGVSWTRDRDIACWFAMRDGRMPFVVTTFLCPDAIVVEHNGRQEKELIVDPIGINVWLDVLGLTVEPDEPFEVPPHILADWQAASDRYEKRLRDQQSAMLKPAGVKHRG